MTDALYSTKGSLQHHCSNIENPFPLRCVSGCFRTNTMPNVFAECKTFVTASLCLIYYFSELCFKVLLSTVTVKTDKSKCLQ